jgi:hypothetical protein
MMCFHAVSRYDCIGVNPRISPSASLIIITIIITPLIHIRNKLSSVPKDPATGAEISGYDFHETAQRQTRRPHFLFRQRLSSRHHWRWRGGCGDGDDNGVARGAPHVNEHFPGPFVGFRWHLPRSANEQHIQYLYEALSEAAKCTPSPRRFTNKNCEFFEKLWPGVVIPHYTRYIRPTTLHKIAQVGSYEANRQYEWMKEMITTYKWSKYWR